MGYPFDSNRFTFVGGQRHSLYDAGTGTGASTTGAGIGSPSGESHTTANDNYDHDHEHLIHHISHQGPSTTIDMPSELGTTSSTTAVTISGATGPPLRPAKNPSRSLLRGPEKRGGPRQKKQMRATASAIDLADMHLTSLGPLPSIHSLRPCHSFASSGTGYMASMSAGNTSIEDDQQESEHEQLTDEEDTRHHKDERTEGKQKQTQQQEDNEEEAKNRRRLSRSRLQAPNIQDPDRSVRISWTPNQFPLETAVAITDEDTNNATNNEDDDTYMKEEWIPRCDSGAILLGSNRSPASSNNVDSMRHLHTASSSSASSCGTPSPRNQSPFPWSKLRSAVTPGSSRPAGGLKKSMDLDGSASSSTSVQTAPQENAQIQGRQQLSVQTSSLLHQRSIVDLIQSKEAQVSPLSALSASLPFQDTAPSQDRERVEEGDTKWMSVQCNYPVRSVSAGSTRRGSGNSDDNVEKTNDQARGQDDNDDDSSDDKDGDPRHFSLQSELGIIEHQPGQDPAASVVVTPRQHRPLSAPMLSHQNISFRPMPSSPCTPSPLTQNRVHALSAFGRHSSERARPISHPALIPSPPIAAAAPRSFVKATVGTAFHHTALLRNGPPSSPYTSPRSSMHIRDSSNNSLLNFQSSSGVTSTLGEYRAYLVADPNDLAAQEALPAASRHRSSSSLSSIDFGDQQEFLARPKRELPDWIQFNNKMRSLWGRPVPGSAGEWHVSLVQSRMVDVPTVPAAILPQPPATVASLSSDLRRKSFTALTGGDTSAPVTAAATTSSSTATTPTNSLFNHSQSSMIPKEQEEREVQVELVMLLVREPGEIPPKTPPLGATRWGSPLQFGGPGASRLSFEVPSTRPSLDLNSCVTSTEALAAPCTPSPLVRVMTNTDISSSSVMMDPTTPIPTATARASADAITAMSNPHLLFKGQEGVEPLIRSEFAVKSQNENQQLLSKESPSPESNLAPIPISPMPASVIPAPTRTVGQRVLAERRRIEAAMQQQQQEQKNKVQSISRRNSSCSSSGIDK